MVMGGRWRAGREVSHLLTKSNRSICMDLAAFSGGSPKDGPQSSLDD